MLNNILRQNRPRARHWYEADKWSFERELFGLKPLKAHVSISNDNRLMATTQAFPGCEVCIVYPMNFPLEPPEIFITELSNEELRKRLINSGFMEESGFYHYLQLHQFSAQIAGAAVLRWVLQDLTFGNAICSNQNALLDADLDAEEMEHESWYQYELPEVREGVSPPPVII